jgi:hypothetical protein
MHYLLREISGIQGNGSEQRPFLLGMERDGKVVLLLPCIVIYTNTLVLLLALLPPKPQK